MTPVKVAVAYRATMFSFGAADVPIQNRTGFRKAPFRRAPLLFATRAHSNCVLIPAMNADEHSEDGLRHRPRVPFTPSEAWIDAFDRQCTEDMLKIPRRYAAWLARLAGDQGSESAATCGEELVQNALADIVAGVRRWDPKIELRRYLMDVIRARSVRARKREAKQRERYEHISLDAIDPDLGSSVEVEALLAVAAVAPVLADEPDRDQDAEMLGRRLAEVRALASHDPHAERILDAIDQGGALRSSDIKRASGLSSVDYRNARRRLVRIASQLHARQRPAKNGTP